MKALPALVILLALFAIGEDPAQAAPECSAGWGRKVVKLAGLSMYPQACRSTVCHVSSHEASLVIWDGFPMQPTTVFHYQAKASRGLDLPACPADVNAAAFKRP